MFVGKVKNLLQAKIAIQEEKDNVSFEDKDFMEKIEHIVLYPFD
jgi:hypothetical protein